MGGIGNIYTLFVVADYRKPSVCCLQGTRDLKQSMTPRRLHL